jgi:hypothetical protein
MRKLAIAALALTVTAPAIAADANSSAEDDLRCAIWAGHVAGSTDDEKTKQGVGFILTYFIGRYEGASGRRFEDGATVDYVASVVPQLGSLQETCKVRMQSFGQRLIAWGEHLQKAAQGK